jgi:hypothetical protein
VCRPLQALCAYSFAGGEQERTKHGPEGEPQGRGKQIGCSVDLSDDHADAMPGTASPLGFVEDRRFDAA